jgi:bifunctional non-homologous end joining protein LigD
MPRTLKQTKPAGVLPAFVEPMHPTLARPFKSERYDFELKWDGVRSVAFRDYGGYRLVSRRRVDMTVRYPEFACLARLPAGTILDGEIVVLQDGRPDFASVLRRERQVYADKAHRLASTLPATYLVFDALYADARSVMHEPLESRRARARELAAKCKSPCVIFSETLSGDCHAQRHFHAARTHEGRPPVNTLATV